MSDFDDAKERTLGTLLRTLNGQRDLSPKGFVDTPVIHILELINSHKDYVSTSSCSGRIAVYEAVKDKGVQWLLVKHAPVTINEVESSINKRKIKDSSDNNNNNNFTMLKCESFILHILCRDIHSAKLLLNIALECGYRESGITLGKGTRVMLAIRTTAFGLEVPLAINSSSTLSPTILFSNSILSLVIKEANKKLLLNFARIDNFLNKLKKCWGWPNVFITNENSRCRRWGHSCLKSTSNPSSYYVIGGYGVNDNNSTDPNDNGEKSSRKLNSVLVNTATNEISSLGIDKTNSMHSAVEHLLNKFYIVSGGRSAPSTPLPCLVVYDENFKQVKIIEEGDIPNPRWGHSLTRFNSNSSPKYYTYFLFGGRDANTICGDAYVLTCHLDAEIIHCTWSKIWQENGSVPARFFHASVGLPDNINNSDHDNENDADNISSKDNDIVELILIHGGLLSLEESNTDSSFLIINPSNSEVRNMAMYDDNRNSIISRFAHTLTYVGKNTIFLIGGTSFDDHDNIESESSVSYRLDFVRSIDDDNYVSIIGDIQPLKISNAEQLPCAKCRCHHQAIYCSITQALHLVGGGQLCLGFGAHYCQSLTLSITHDFEIIDPKELSTSNPTNNNYYNKRKVEAGIDQNTLVIFISAPMLKKTKTFLEDKNFFDKTRRIAPTDSNVDAIRGKFAVPVQVGFIKCLKDNEFSQSTITELASFIDSSKSGSNIIPIEISDTNFNEEASDSINLFYGFQSPFLNKSIVTSGNRKAFDYLENTISTFQNIDDATANSMRRNIPKKFEFVGDVLMIPSETLNCYEWEQLLDKDNAFWSGLAECFGLSRVARKSKIDSGPKRESKVMLLLPPYGQPKETGPSSPGWVTVTENSIQYSFDITRVMFCSGNITEKIRMGKESCEGQIVVDLYCGIGYYTLPFLIHGNAAHVHACEWNCNSVLALTENFKNNKVSSNRYSIYENDNRITAPTLRNVADRICLGLLPSSEQGWPLAAIVLKPSGGILHVHENVNDDNIEQFSVYLLNSLQKLFNSEGKNFNSKIIKIEKVKSYAPHVLHIVFDVLCIPI